MLGRLTLDKMGYSMPVDAPAYQAPPYHYRNAQAISIKFETDRDAALKAVTDNMAKLKALRLAREAAAPAPAATVKKPRAKSKTSAEKSPALGDWLAGQQSGGRRT